MKLHPFDWLKIAVVALIFFGGVSISYFMLRPERRLPVYNPSSLDPRLVADSLQDKGRNHRRLPFTLVNQYGDTITESTTEGKIYLADFFFTVCPDICRDMAEQKRRIQGELREDSLFMILSHSVTPVYDSVPVLRAYGEQQGALRGKWHLLTGPKKEIYRLARQSYFAVLDEGGEGDEADFIHTENFVLVDPKGRLRGFYDGTSAEDVDRFLADFQVLRVEFFNE